MSTSPHGLSKSLRALLCVLSSVAAQYFPAWCSIPKRRAVERDPEEEPPDFVALYHIFSLYTANVVLVSFVVLVSEDEYSRLHTDRVPVVNFP